LNDSAANPPRPDVRISAVVLVVVIGLAACASSATNPVTVPVTPSPKGLPSPQAAPQSASTAPRASNGPTFAQLVGQKLLVRMDGTVPSTDLLGRIRRGEVGGVILLGANVTTRSAFIALTQMLHAAAAAGGQPRLLVAVDQEGGTVKRIPWAPPTLSASQVGAIGSIALARS
jgi:beta-N-acetylhexosaminidase